MKDYTGIREGLFNKNNMNTIQRSPLKDSRIYMKIGLLKQSCKQLILILHKAK